MCLSVIIQCTSMTPFCFSFTSFLLLGVDLKNTPAYTSIVLLFAEPTTALVGGVIEKKKERKERSTVQRHR